MARPSPPSSPTRKAPIRYVAFLRAINVGGHIVKMAQLRTAFEAIPLAGVSTFIASGNVIFESGRIAGLVETAIETQLKSTLGYEVATMVRSGPELAAVVRHVEKEALGPAPGITLYVGFLKTAPAPEVAKAVGALSNDVDVLSVRGRELYWRCNKSFAESTVAGPRLEKLLKVPATVRNFNTVRRLTAKMI
jgi:uncharacterized protein (DUF1697 family)